MNDIDGSLAVILFVAISSIVLSIREIWKMYKREKEYEIRNKAAEQWRKNFEFEYKRIKERFKNL